ncbi:MAG TPA: FtsX-like permease family protein, partial [Bacteroidota bacterium]|nr:FtsX-like permease family protein [Bacteroidota bacterium]
GRISVRKAMDNFGVSAPNGAKDSLAVKLTRSRIFGETFALSVRNVFRRRSRLLLSLGLLSAGGAMFLTALNVSSAWDANLEKIRQQRFYDLDIRLHQSADRNAVLERVRSVSGINTLEAWRYSSTSFVTDRPYDIVQTYPDKGHGSFLIIGLPVPTQMINLPIQQGTWLRDPGAKDVVLNHMAIALSPSLRVGDSISLSIDQTPTRWRIVGIAEDLYSPATAYVGLPAFAASCNDQDGVNMLRMTMTDKNPDAVAQKSRMIEDALNSRNFSILQSIPASLFRNAIGEHMGVLVNSLIAMAILMAIVGMLGLTSTMSMNIMERTRELGVMRALGATPRVIRRLVLTEGLVIGVMSLGFALPLSFVMSSSLGQWLGTMAFRSPLSLTVSIFALVMWTTLIVVGSIVSTLYPARRATRITTREALAYE